MPTLTSIAPDLAKLHYGLQEKHGRISARRTANGTTQIFVRQKNTLAGKIYDQFVGRKLARKEIDRILDSTPKVSGAAAQQAVEATRQAARHGRVDELQKQVKVIAAALTNDYQAPAHAGDKLAAGGLGELPHLDVAGSLRPALAKAAAGDISDAVALLENSLNSTALCAKEKSRHLPALLAFETRGKAELAEQLQALSPGLMTAETAKRIVDVAYESVVQSTFPTVPASCDRDPATNNCTNIGEYTLPDGARFTRDQKDIENGGFGSVGFFTVGDKNVVLKWIQSNDTTKTTARANRDILNEACMQHRAHEASDFGKRAVMNVEHVVRMPDGRWALAMEVGERGDLFSKQERIAAGSEDLKKYVAHSLVEITAALRAANVSHDDLKEPNIFVTASGDIKVADFGEAQEGDFQWVGSIHGNPTWMSPEAVAASNAVAANVKSIVDKYGANVSNLDQSDESKAARRANSENREAEINPIKKKGAVVSGFGADSWALGLMIFRTFAGQNLFTYKDFQFEVETKQAQYTSLETEQARSDYLFSGPPGSAVPEFARQTILDLLHPDPASRTSPAKVIESGVFEIEPDRRAQARTELAKL